ncbi:hypothetical protein BN12_240021 [Nostocoides japonicum T1-X7]|uniref:Uncharacterized protein n=1 Tax=Nostocoides japonicum T1-X7 TaxID=1194083 RepID=A0A077LYG4_9MICO|nr:hypothetical protein BN12_240021 [Tetrasphaera japonica T1-X7]
MTRPGPAPSATAGASRRRRGHRVAARHRQRMPRRRWQRGSPARSGRSSRSSGSRRILLRSREHLTEDAPGTSRHRRLAHIGEIVRLGETRGQRSGEQGRGERRAAPDPETAAVVVRILGAPGAGDQAARAGHRHPLGLGTGLPTGIEGRGDGAHDGDARTEHAHPRSVVGEERSGPAVGVLGSHAGEGHAVGPSGSEHGRREAPGGRIVPRTGDDEDAALPEELEEPPEALGAGRVVLLGVVAHGDRQDVDHPAGVVALLGVDVSGQQEGQVLAHHHLVREPCAAHDGDGQDPCLRAALADETRDERPVAREIGQVPGHGIDDTREVRVRAPDGDAPHVRADRHRRVGIEPGMVADARVGEGDDRRPHGHGPVARRVAHGDVDRNPPVPVEERRRPRIGRPADPGPVLADAGPVLADPDERCRRDEDMVEGDAGGAGGSGRPQGRHGAVGVDGRRLVRGGQPDTRDPDLLESLLGGPVETLEPGDAVARGLDLADRDVDARLAQCLLDGLGDTTGIRRRGLDEEAVHDIHRGEHPRHLVGTRGDPWSGRGVEDGDREGIHDVGVGSPGRSRSARTFLAVGLTHRTPPGAGGWGCTGKERGGCSVIHPPGTWMTTARTTAWRRSRALRPDLLETFSASDVSTAPEPALPWCRHVTGRRADRTSELGAAPSGDAAQVALSRFGRDSPVRAEPWHTVPASWPLVVGPGSAGGTGTDDDAHGPRAVRVSAIRENDNDPGNTQWPWMLLPAWAAYVGRCGSPRAHRGTRRQPG